MSARLGPTIAPVAGSESQRTLDGPAARPRGQVDTALAAVVVVCLGGIAARVVFASQSLFADELSTYWIVARHGFGQVLDLLYSHGRIQHAEITPPLLFLASWVSAQVGHGPELIRAPSLLSGVLTLPALYALGRRSVGRPAALLAVALTALSPFMIYYSAEARSYALMMLLVVCSTLSMLLAVDTGRRRWWVAYALASAGAFLTHYTCAFALLAQFAWLLWACPNARRAALVSNLGALLVLMPWVPGLINDFRSPTTQILSALSPFSPYAIRISLEHWALGYPYVAGGGLTVLPGLASLVLLALGGIALLYDRLPRPGSSVQAGGGAGFTAAPWAHLWQGFRSRRGLIALLALSVPVGEILASAVSTHIFGVRNLAASWPALSLIASALLMSARGRLRTVIACLAVLSFGLGAARMFSARFRRTDFIGVAAYIDRRAAPGDVVLDGTLSPGPLNGLDITLRKPLQVIRFVEPQEHDHPFTLFDRTDPVQVAVRRGFALALADRSRVFLVRYTTSPPVQTPRSYRLVAVRAFPSLTPLTVEVLVPRA